MADRIGLGVARQRGLCLAAVLLLIAAVTELILGIKAEGKSLESIADPCLANSNCAQILNDAVVRFAPGADGPCAGPVRLPPSFCAVARLMWC
jgi:hypothetical protein